MTWDSVFRPVRQPDWWQGDAEYHAPAYTEPVSELERRLKAGEFVVTSEVAPPLTHCDQEADREHRADQALRGGDQLHRQPFGHAAHVELGVQHPWRSRTAPSR